MVLYEDDVQTEQHKGWMSRGHGRAPEFAGFVRYSEEDKDEVYLTALWEGEHDDVIYVAAEIVERKEHALKKSEVRHLCGWILNTLSWRRKGRKYECFTDDGFRVVIKELKGDMEEREHFYREVIEESVKILTANTSGASMLLMQGE